MLGSWYKSVNFGAGLLMASTTLGALLLVRSVVTAHLNKCEVPLYGRLSMASTTLGGSLSGV